MYKGQDFKILKFGPENFLRDMIAQVRNGIPVLIEDVEENVDPAIDPILNK
jgi:dynein heavy chain